MPTWVKVLLVATALLLVGILIGTVAGGGGHGPSRHGAGTLRAAALVVIGG